MMQVTDTEQYDNPFDAFATNWDKDSAHRQRATAVAQAIMRVLPRGGNWLDLGAGTGLLGLNLCSHAQNITLLDSSSSMLEIAVRSVEQAKLGDRVTTMRCDIEEWYDQPNSIRYDAITSLMFLHHIEDQESLIRACKERLQPQGWIAFADMDVDDGSFHAQESIAPAHHGTDRVQLCQWLSDSGFIDVQSQTVFYSIKVGRQYPIFLVTGQLS